MPICSKYCFNKNIFKKNTYVYYLFAFMLGKISKRDKFPHARHESKSSKYHPDFLRFYFRSCNASQVEHTKKLD